MKTSMKLVKSIAAVLILSASFLSANSLIAHTALAVAMPADGAILNEGPKEVTLRFTEAVRLLQLSLKNGTSMAVETGFKPNSSSATAFTVMMPELTAGTYTVNWAVMGADSHRVEGEFSFTVDPMAAETMGTNHEMPEQHDAH